MAKIIVGMLMEGQSRLPPDPIHLTPGVNAVAENLARFITKRPELLLHLILIR